MSCIETVCGTGYKINPPPPGDPDTNIVVAATTVTGGIQVSWSYPALLSHAVQHTLLYRATTNNFSNAIQRGIVAGNIFNDQIDVVNPTTYYYWARIVTVNGTVGVLCGPASAVARNIGDVVIEELTGKIVTGVLATSLREKIDRITLNYQELLTEITERIGGNEALMAALADLEAGLVDAVAMLEREVTLRVDGENALGLIQETLAVLTREVIAAIFDDSIVGVNAAGDTIAGAIKKIYVANQEVQAAVLNVQTAKIGYSAVAATGRAYDGDRNTIVYPVAKYSANTYPHYANDRRRIIDAEGVTNWNATPAGATKPLVWIVGMPLATAVLSVGVTDATGDEASLEQAFVAQKDLNGKFSALYTVKVQANGLVGGFGIYGDEEGIEAGFDVDRFWIGRTEENGDLVKTLPFVIDKGIVYINKAYIKEATIDTLRIVGNSVTVSVGSSSQTGGILHKEGTQRYVEVGVTATHPGRIIVIATVNVPNSGHTQRLYVQKNGDSGSEVAFESLIGGATSCFVYTTDVAAGFVGARVGNSDLSTRNLGITILLTYR